MRQKEAFNNYYLSSCPRSVETQQRALHLPLLGNIHVNNTKNKCDQKYDQKQIKISAKNSTQT